MGKSSAGTRPHQNDTPRTTNESEINVTEMSFDDFRRPSEMPGGGGSHPSLGQLAGRLVWIMPTAREDGVTTELKRTPHTRLTVDLAFLDGAPIDRIEKRDGTATPLTPPVQPGQVMTGRFMNQAWFVSRLKDRIGQPGFPGIVGVVGKVGNAKPGQDRMWGLVDPSDVQMEQVKAWFRWYQTQPPEVRNYVPAPPAPPVVPQVPGFAAAAGQTAYGTPPVYGQGAPASPFAQPPAAYAPQPAAQPQGQWQPQMPPGMAPAAPVAGQQPPAAPAAQPGPEVPPWQR